MSSLKPKESGTLGPRAPRQSRWMSILLIVAVVAIGVLAYGQYSAKNSLEARVASLEGKLQENLTQLQKGATAMASDIQVITEHVGVTDKELANARAFAEKLRMENQKAQEKLATELAQKASSEDVDAAREEAATKVAEAQKASETKIGSVSTEVKTVASNLETTRQDLAASRRDLVDVKNALSDQIAHNASELATLRQKGERDFFDINLRKTKKDQMQRVGDIRLELRSTDTKRQKYSIIIQVDDKKLEKKDKLINEPVQFLVGSDQLRYEIVVNKVEKDRIVGYLSTPKNKVLSAERPTLR